MESFRTPHHRYPNPSLRDKRDRNVALGGVWKRKRVNGSGLNSGYRINTRSSWRIVDTGRGCIGENEYLLVDPYTKSNSLSSSVIVEPYTSIHVSTSHPLHPRTQRTNLLLPILSPRLRLVHTPDVPPSSKRDHENTSIVLCPQIFREIYYRLSRSGRVESVPS
jgi:hypothetical protein